MSKIKSAKLESVTKPQIENLKAQMQGKELNIYQKADALIEFNKLLNYISELEQKLLKDE